MSIWEAYQTLSQRLAVIYPINEARNIAEMILENISGLSRIDRMIQKTLPLTDEQQKRFSSFEQQLLDQKPVQYVLNEAWFCGMKFYVDEQVLIPRPETEELVDWIVRDVRAGNLQHLQIIDLGTGSGCIPISLKKKISSSVVSAADISEAALQVARKNAMILEAEVSFIKMDMLAENERAALGQYDIIVSNPPYIPLRDKETMHPNVLNYEPWIALFVENDEPLSFYKVISAFGLSHLKENGSVYVEIHEDLATAVVEIFKQDGYSKILVRKDMQGKERMIKASL